MRPHGGGPRGITWADLAHVEPRPPTLSRWRGAPVIAGVVATVVVVVVVVVVIVLGGFAAAGATVVVVV